MKAGGNDSVIDEYDVGRYTDEELYQLMDLSNPTDRELEARIIQLIRKYSTIHNESGRLIMNFFKDIYEHFFEGDDDDEDRDNAEDTDGDAEDIKSSINNESKEGFETIASKAAKVRAAQDQGQETDSGRAIMLAGESSKPMQSVLVNQLDYTKDRLNPLLKQTIRRVISIDSQYRDTKYPLSTEYTFNLSEPLRDVVSLRLYSIQIPVTWYTISNNFGGNFFILKGNAPGILDRDEFSYKVEIASGNYTAENLAKAVDDSIQRLKATYTDVSFGDMGITYNPINSLATMNLSIRNVFTENNYGLQFAEWSSPIETDASGVLLRYTENTTLPAYLGFNSQNYALNSIRSVQNLPLIENSVAEDTNNAVYLLDASNNYFDIVQYRGPSEYIPGSSSVLNTIRIQLDLSGAYSRNAIVSEINSKLSQNPFLVSSGIIRTNIVDVNLENFGRSYYTMTIRLDKTRTISEPNMKTVVIFPQETNSSVRIWSKFGAPAAALCALNFPYIYNELSDLVAETQSFQTNYIVKSRPYIVYKCITPGYTNPYSVGDYSSVIDICFNDYKIILPESPDIGWSFAEYLQTINTAYSATNAQTIDSANIAGIFNMLNTGIYNDIQSSRIFFRTDINRIFLKENYVMDLSGSDLFNTLRLGSNVSISGDSIDLSINNVLTSTITALPSYRIDSSFIAVILPKPGYSTNVNAALWNVVPVPELRTGQNLQQFVGFVNASFQAFQDFSGSNPLTESSLSATFNQDNTVTFSLSVRITKTLTENDYQIQFYDASASSGTVNLAINYWDFDGGNGNPKRGTIAFAPTTVDASFVPFTRSAVGYSATNTGAPLGTIYGFQANGPVIPASSNWTLNFWYYSVYSSTAMATQVLFSQYSPTAQGETVRFIVDAGTYTLYIDTTPVAQYTDTSFVLENTWHMFTVRRNGYAYSIFLDGVNKITTVASVSNVILQGEPFALGLHGNARGYWDEVAFWDYALTDEIVADTFSSFIWQNTVNNSWYNNLKIGDASYNLVDYKVQSTSYADIFGINVISGFTYTITEDTSFVLFGNVSGITDASSAIIIHVPASTNPNNEYTRQQLFNIINNGLAANPLSAGSYITTSLFEGKEYVRFRFNLNQVYTAKDYRVVFYDPFSFVRCYVGIKSVRNASWDTSLGWILGFRLTTEYILGDYGTTNPITIVGDTAITTNLYNYFLIVLDDYTQSHLNDGLVTVVSQENEAALPSYANRTKITCDTTTGDPVFNDPNLTQNQIYAANQILQSKKTRQRYTSSPVVQDVFALIPMKTGGLANGSSYIEFGGTLQNQERTYFGPVNIQRMTIRLLNDRGDVVDLNGSNWSFSLICEQLYQQKSV